MPAIAILMGVVAILSSSNEEPIEKKQGIWIMRHPQKMKHTQNLAANAKRVNGKH
jgi:hypothetical protein